MKNVVRILLMGVLMLSLVGCDGGPSGVQASVVQSEAARETSLDVPPADLADLVAGNSALAFDLYDVLRAQGSGNLFYSPYSISLALAMTYAGARGETEQQMVEVLHFTLPQTQLHPAFNQLDLLLAQRGEGARGKGRDGFRLNVVNAIWGQRGYEFLPEFLDVLAQNYGAGLRVLDFASDPEASRKVINTWVSDQTEERIEDLIPRNVIDEMTRLVLTNAIYFNAAWAEPFEADQTQDGVFNTLEGTQVTVPMMQQTTSLGYAGGEGYQVVALPYDGHELEMLILLPDVGTFEAFEQSLDAARVEAMLETLAFRQVALTMPKFDVESSFSLAEVLKSLGMPDAFSMAADFSGMDGTYELFIQDVVHKAFVTVDEEGTEAAAATAVIVGLKGMMPEEPVEVTVDRPFVFLIRDIQTGTVLFVGRVVNPSA